MSERGEVPMPRVTLERARAAKALALSRYRGFDNVVGVGITRLNDEYAIKVNLSEPMPSDVTLPTQIDGVPVRVEVTGRIRPRSVG